ncbi:hypothetical protein F5884DRAFT_783695 [Xylogone sp. PMI_703]|nr:hypothetical protein F5884DRAFT_783695 [Xylogone sp. PMI_703]
MNWTGGHLSRHYRKSKGSLTSQQKQHFSKAQNKFRNISNHATPHKCPSLPHDLDLHDNLNSVHMRPHDPSFTEEPPDRQILLPVRPVDVNLQEDGGIYNSKSQRRHYEARSMPLTEKVATSVIPDDDLYSATPLPWQRNQKHKTPNTTVQEYTSTGDDIFVHKRRKLLHRDDWVGINTQELPPLRFAPPEQDYNVGRRRKITDAHRARYNTPPHRPILSPFVRSKLARATNNGFNQWSSGNGEIGARDSSVKIHIGGRVVHAGASSSSQYSRSRMTPALVSGSDPPQSSYTVSSDTMLLDNELSHTQKSWSSSQKKNSGYLSLEGEINPHEVRKDSHASPPVSIYHPIPLSARKSRLIRSPLSTASGSNVSQMGQSELGLTSSQEMENSRWKSWIIPSGTHDRESRYSSCVDKLHESDRMSIDSEQSSSQDNENGLESNGLNEDRTETSGSLFQKQNFRHPNVTGSYSQYIWNRKRHMDSQNMSESTEQDSNIPSFREDNPNVRHDTDSELDRGIGKDVNVLEKDSLDRTWMNFVFGVGDHENHDTHRLLARRKDKRSEAISCSKVNLLGRQSAKRDGVPERSGRVFNAWEGATTTNNTHNTESSPECFSSSTSGSMSVHTGS